jgi:oligoribonuclease
LQRNLIWIDLEMTGLDPEKMVILEIASVITSAKLDIIAEGPNIAINYPEEILKEMEEWSLNHHSRSGLMSKVRESRIECRQAEQETLKFLSVHCKKNESPMCGNSVWQDRRFLIKYMPDLEDFFHYRIVDVSTIKELVTRWYPSVPPFEKRKTHLALSDIHESIKELKYYRDTVFRT